MGGSRLVTLGGAGGVGKTRLAQRVVSLGAAAARESTVVAWADLSPLRNAHLLAATVADALGLSDHTPRLSADVICAWIGDRETLLVLDSCEHLPAECRPRSDTSFSSGRRTVRRIRCSPRSAGGCRWRWRRWGSRGSVRTGG
ncbi:NB-ARC domain-containing protein [Streptomyces sp. NPDC001980]|uniref:NB-ARC domain-containing protein n=1 Tax=Streptomyces sp. NPDC001980 TaxID=3157126 RepID=UPI0033269B79